MAKKTNRILFCFLLLIFLINFHYYSFYLKSFKDIFRATGIKPNFLSDQYLALQQYHPFADLFFMSQDSQDKAVYYLFTRYDPKSILMDELFIRVNYFFYPRIIWPETKLKAFLNMEFNPGDLIVSDYNLNEESLGQRLEPIMVKDLSTLSQDYFFRRDKTYYLFKVVR